MLELMEEFSSFETRRWDADGEGSSIFGSGMFGEGGWFRE
jgi:hypothetical protein